MKKQLAIAVFCCSLMLLSHSAHAQQSGVGVGAILNGPTGLSVKAWAGDNLAFDGALSFQLSENFQSLYLHSDLLYHNNALNRKLELDNASLRTYYGAGIRIIFSDFDDTIGLRFPAGLTYSVSNAPLGTFFELVPTLDLEPVARFSFSGAIGIRYYLN
jgi:hypothetical protein